MIDLVVVIVVLVVGNKLAWMAQNWIIDWMTEIQKK
jgi:hypothetical protein